MLAGGGLAAVRLLTGMARSKWLATRFGLEGVGLLAQATQLQLLAVSASSLSVTSALIQGSRGDFRTKPEQLFQTAFFLIICGASALAALSFAMGPAKLGAWLFGGGHGAEDFLLVLVSIPFVLLASAFTEAAYFIHDRFDRYSLVSAIHSVCQPLVFVGLTISYGQKGILLAFPVMAALLTVLFVGELWRLGLLRASWFIPRWNGEMARFLAGHGFAMFLTGVGGGFLLLFVRSRLVGNLGLAENGMLQVPIALSAYGGAVVTNFIWGRIHPTVSASLGSREESDVSLTAFVAYVVALGTWAVAPLLIPLVYSRAFVPAVPLVGIQATGDVFYYGFFMLAVVLLATGRIALYVAAWAVFYAPYVLALFLPELQGVRAITSLHLVASATAFTALAGWAAFTGLLPKAVSRRLVSMVLACALFLGMAWQLDPATLPVRWTLALLLLTAGLFAWRFIYGEIADMNQLKALIRKTQKATRIDGVLAILLRGGLLPRMAERLAPQYRDYPAPSIRRVRRDGLSVDLDLSDLPDWKAYFRLRDKKRERMYALVPRGAAMLEIGCARGWVALNLARIVGPGGRIVAADAHRPSAELTAERLKANGFTWASAHCIAFSDREGTVTMAPEAAQNSASVSISSAEKGETVRAARLDDWLKENAMPDFDVLKISVNGWETHAFRGASEYIKRRKPLIFTEVGDGNLRRSGSSPEELLRFFAELGYRLETTWGDPTIPSGPALNGSLFDVVAFPPSS